MDISETVDVAAAPEAVWALVSDVANMGRWSPETIRASWIDGAAAPAVGARFKGTNKRGIVRWSTTCTVTECEPGAAFAFRVGQGPTTWTYRFAGSADGCTVTETATIADDASTVERILYRVLGTKDRPADLRQGIRSTIGRIKIAAEGGATPV